MSQEDVNELNARRSARSAVSREITGATSTITQADNGSVVSINHASAHTCTLAGPFAIGFQCLIVQGGAGQVEFVPDDAETVSNRQGHTKTQGDIYSEVSLVANDDDALVLAGDTGN